MYNINKEILHSNRFTNNQVVRVLNSSYLYDESVEHTASQSITTTTRVEFNCTTLVYAYISDDIIP